MPTPKSIVRNPKLKDSEGKELSVKAARRQLRDANEEFRDLTGDESPSALSRRTELRRELRNLQSYLLSKEDTVTIDLPTSSIGDWFQIGDRKYPPGQHTVPASVAQVLLHMVSQNKERELDLMRQNGRTIDLKNIGDRARMDEIAAE